GRLEALQIARHESSLLCATVGMAPLGKSGRGDCCNNCCMRHGVAQARVEALSGEQNPGAFAKPRPRSPAPTTFLAPARACAVLWSGRNAEEADVKEIAPT